MLIVPKEPYMPTPPIEAVRLPPISVETILLETLLEVILAQSGKKRRARMIADLYEKADELEMMGSVRRIRSLDQPAEARLQEKRRQAASLLKALADLSSREFIDRQGR